MKGISSPLKNILTGIIMILFLGSSITVSGKPVIRKYDLKYSFDFRKHRVYCKAELTFLPLQENDTLDLLIYRLLRVKSIKNDFGEEIKFSQETTTFSDWDLMQANHIKVNTRDLGTDKPVERLIMEFEGYILGYTETGMRYAKDRIDPSFTILRPDCFAYPVQAAPSLESLIASGSAEFDYSVTLIVPDTLSVVNGGLLREKTSGNGTTQYIFENLKPASRIDIAIGKYSKLEEKGFTVYYFPEDSIGANSVAESVQKVYSLYNKWFGEKAFSDYSIVEIPDGFGSQTDVSCILQTSSAFKDPDKLYELHHELFHTWDIPSNDKIPCRMESEGLATFIQAFVDEKVTGDVGLLDKSAQKTFEGLKNKFARDTMLAQIPMADFGKKQMTTLSYTKGMLFFYLLYKMVGEEEFTGLIRDYYTQFRPKGATTEDFSNFLITRFKNKKVEFLVNDWIRTNSSSKQILAASSVQNLLL